MAMQLSLARSAAATLYLSLCLREVGGITTAGDPNQGSYIVQPSSYPYFVSLGERGNCAGAVISAKHVITAARCYCPTPLSPLKAIFSDDSHMYANRVYFNPGCMFSCNDDSPNRCDVAIMEFDTEINETHTPLPIYTHSDQVGKELTILGYGNTGDAGQGSCIEGDGKMRRAKNIVTSIEGGGIFGGVIKYTMDQNGLALEGMAQGGDSGGPAVIERDGTTYLAGVHSGTADIYSNPCAYGAVDEYCRLSAHNEKFIAQVIGTYTRLRIPVHIDFLAYAAIRAGRSFPLLAAVALAMLGQAQ